jgi:hypothetical protein
MIPSVSQYAGEQLLTGQQAEAYADHFIAQHIINVGGGKTYSQLSAEPLAQPNNTQLPIVVATVFKGETLRSMLLNAYGWWKISLITYMISLAMFGLGGLALAGPVFGLAFGCKTEPDRMNPVSTPQPPWDAGCGRGQRPGSDCGAGYGSGRVQQGELDGEEVVDDVEGLFGRDLGLGVGG